MNFSTWREMMAALPTLTEDELKVALSKEHRGKARVSFLIRIHQRYCMSRQSRERKELLAG